MPGAFIDWCFCRLGLSPSGVFVVWVFCHLRLLPPNLLSTLFCRRGFSHAIIRELAWTDKCMHQSYLMKIIIRRKSYLNDYLGCRCWLLCKLRQKGSSLNSSGHWHQQFERASSWDMVKRCNLSKQNSNTTRWVWFQILTHSSLPWYRGNTK